MASFFLQITKNKFRLFGLLWFSVMLFYLPSYKAGFVGELISYLQSFEEDSFLDFINRKQAYVISFYQLSTFVRYLCIALFGAQPIPWFLFFTASHALIGTLAYWLFSSLFRDFKLDRAGQIAFCGTLLFLFNPNISEVTIWKGTDHYYVSILLHLANILLVRKYITSLNVRYAIWAAITFIFSAFALEIFYIIPIITFVLAVGYLWVAFIDTVQFRKVLKWVLLPQVLLFFVYLISFKLIHGSWIAHYGTTDEFVWSFQDIVKGYGKYIAYMGLMLGHFPHDIRLPVYAFLGQPIVSYLIVFSIVVYLSVGLYNFKKLNANGQLLLFVVGLFICSITLCLTTFFDDLFSIYNSRRCYHAGVFFYMAIALFIFRIKKHKAAFIVWSLYFSICLLLSVMMIFRWRNAAEIQYGVLKSFAAQKAKNIVLLNLPTYFKDIRMIPASGENEFGRQLRYFGHQPIEGKLFSVLGYNMNSKWDGAHVVVLDSLRLKVTLNQWGSWWMYGSQGAANYKNELFSVNITDIGHEYILSFNKVPDTSTVILFQQGTNWRRVDWAKEGDQW